MDNSGEGTVPNGKRDEDGLSKMERFLREQKKLHAKIREKRRENSVLVAYASQTGVSEMFAYRTTDVLLQAGLTVDCQPFWKLDPAALESRLYVLFLVSSTGRGRVPPRCAPLVEELSKVSDSGVSYSLLGLGDSRFVTFCGGARLVDEALRNSGAKPFLPMREADAKGNHTEENWRSWIREVAEIKGFGLPDLSLEQSDPIPVKLEFLSKTRLDDGGKDVEATWAIEFAALDDAPFHSGDALLLTPPDLAKAMDGDESEADDEKGDPGPFDARETRERSYSIGSSSEDGDVVRLTVTAREKGLCSLMLADGLAPGDRVDAAIKPNHRFNVPLYSAEPVIMIARGSGVAPFRGFLDDVERRPRVTWLFFANERHDGDDLYREYWEERYDKGKLTHLDMVFADEAGPSARDALVDRMVEKGERLHKLVHDESALVYVCGGVDLLTREVREAFMTLHERHGDGLLEPVAWFEQLLVKGQMRMESHAPPERD